MRQIHQKLGKGIPEDTARQLLMQLLPVEKDVPLPRLAMFSRFEGLVSMDQHDAHARHAH